MRCPQSGYYRLTLQKSDDDLTYSAVARAVPLEDEPTDTRCVELRIDQNGRQVCSRLRGSRQECGLLASKWGHSPFASKRGRTSVVERQRVKDRLPALTLGRASVIEMEDHFYYSRSLARGGAPELSALR